MKTVVDEGVPFRFAGELRRRGLDVRDFVNEWRGLQNGRLLERIRDAGFECLMTCDKNLRHQQNLARWNLALITLPKTRFADLMPYIDRVAEAFARCERGRALVVAADGRLEIH